MSRSFLFLANSPARDVSNDLFDIARRFDQKYLRWQSTFIRDVKFGKPGANLVKPRLKYRRYTPRAFPCFTVYRKNSSTHTILPRALHDTFREIILSAEYRRIRGGNFNILNTPHLFPSCPKFHLYSRNFARSLSGVRVV